jgi:pimeloyl-ACP methyl ester carboxylesterase
MPRTTFFAVSVLTVIIATPLHAADVLADATSHFAKSGDLKVHYKSLGEGKTPVVFVHGWCCDNSVWRDQAAALDGKCRMLFVDLPGYGKSDKPKGDCTIELMAKGVDAVLRDAGAEKAVLVGHSMGTPVVRQVYRLFPDKVLALVFVDGSLRPFTRDPAQLKRFREMFKEETFKDNAPRILTGMLPPQSPADVRERLLKLVAAADTHSAITSMNSMFDDPKLWKDDPVNVPSQALMAKSPNWTEDYKAYAKKLVPDLDYREFDGVGHFLFMEKPEPFNEALGEFLKKQGVMK